MLETIGVESLDQLINETIPADIRLKNPLELEHIMTEYEFANHIRLLGRTNKVYKSYIGLGYHQQLFRRQFKEIFWKPELVHRTPRTKQKLHRED
jgi:glycine cleavage system pyridoxal-binding protein P